MRLIDGDELAKRIKEEGNHQYYALCNMEATHNYADCYSKVLSAPTIDAVPVVRCKECKWYEPDTSECRLHLCADAWYPDDFCSDGERKEEYE